MAQPIQLPPRTLEVTTNPLVVNLATKRSAEAYVKTLLQLPLRDPRYRKDQYGTWCNLYVHDGLRLLDILSERALAYDLIERWRRPHNQDSMVKMVLQDAIKNASLGCPTVGALQEPKDEHSHVFFVLPQPATTRPWEVLIAQAGLTNFWGRQLVYAVPTNKVARVEWFGAP